MGIIFIANSNDSDNLSSLFPQLLDHPLSNPVLQYYKQGKLNKLGVFSSCTYHFEFVDVDFLVAVDVEHIKRNLESTLWL